MHARLVPPAEHETGARLPAAQHPLQRRLDAWLAVDFFVLNLLLWVALLKSTKGCTSAQAQGTKPLIKASFDPAHAMLITTKPPVTDE